MVTTSTWIQEVLGSNHGRDTRVGRFAVLFTSSRQMPAKYHNQAMAIAFHILSNLLFTIIQSIIQQPELLQISEPFG
jgi:hypothetical protein